MVLNNYPTRINVYINVMSINIKNVLQLYELILSELKLHMKKKIIRLILD
jgi:hypothetical protein